MKPPKLPPAIWLPDIRLDDVTQTSALLVVTPPGEESKTYLLSSDACALLADVLRMPAMGTRDVSRYPCKGDRMAVCKTYPPDEVVCVEYGILTIKRDGKEGYMTDLQWERGCTSPGAIVVRAPE